MKEYEIIVRPHITEKSTDAAANGKYTFVGSIDEFVRSQYQATVSSIRPYWLSYIKTSIITEVVLAEIKSQIK